MTSNKICTLVFPIQNNRVLLAMKKRGFGSGLWNGAGGKIEADETVEQAMIRECFEEIRIRPTQYIKVAEHDFLMDADTENPWHMYVHAFVASEWEGEPTESEEMSPQWFENSSIPYDNMWQDDIYWLPYILDGKKVIGSYSFNSNDKIINHTVKIVEQLPNEIPERITL